MGVHVRMRVGAGGLAPVQHPERSVVLVSATGAMRPTRFVTVDSSIQATPPPAFGRSAIRPPFAPTPSVAFVPPTTLLYSSGTRTTVELHQLNGTPSGSIALAPNTAPRDTSELSQQRTEWIARNAKRFPDATAAETLLARVASLDSTVYDVFEGKINGKTRGRVSPSLDVFVFLIVASTDGKEKH